MRVGPAHGSRSATAMAAEGAASGETESAGPRARWVRYAAPPAATGAGSRKTSNRRFSTSTTQYSEMLAAAYSSAFSVVSNVSEESAISTTSAAVIGWAV